MFLSLFDYFVSALVALVSETEAAVASSADAHALGAVACAVAGVKVETAYQSLPEMNPRTVRRVLAGANDSVRMCMSSSGREEQVHKDSTENAVLDGIREKAEAVRVAPGIAEAAVTRYGNSPDRVGRVLADLSRLIEAGGRVWNPTGLFTRLMRSGQEVKLPARVMQDREAVATAKAAEAAKPVPAVGMWVRLYGEVCQIVGLPGRQFAEVETRDGLVNVSRDALRFVPVPG